MYADVLLTLTRTGHVTFYENFTAQFCRSLFIYTYSTGSHINLIYRADLLQI